MQGRAPWQASKESIARIIAGNHMRPLPGESAGDLSCPFRVNPGGDFHCGWGYSVNNLQSAEWLRMAGSIGVYYVQMTDLHPRYKVAFQSCLWWLHDMRNRTHLKTTLTNNNYNKQDYWTENAAIMEYLMPVHFSSFNAHVMLHCVHSVLTMGPIHAFWMMSSEGLQGIMKKSLKSGNIKTKGQDSTQISKNTFI